MLKFRGECPIPQRGNSHSKNNSHYRWTSYALVLVAGVCSYSPEANTFPVQDGQKATTVIGWNDYVSGYDESDALLGAASPSSSSFFVTSDVAFDTANERLFVSDAHNHRILYFDGSGGITTGMSAAFVLGQPDFSVGGANPDAPYGGRNTLNFSQGCSTAINACGATRIFSVAYDSTRQWLFGADFDNNRVLIWDLAGGITNGMAASYVLGQRDFQTGEANAACNAGEVSGKVNPCGFKSPSDLYYDSVNATLYVADSSNHRVVAFDLSSAPIPGTAAVAVLGQDDLTTGLRANGCGAAGAGTTDACSLNQTFSISLDPSSQRLFVSDYGARRIMVYDVSAGIENGMAAENVLGQPDFVTSTVDTGCSLSDTGISGCGLGEWDVNIDYNGNDDVLYAADSANNRVLVFDVAAISDGEEAIAVLGRPDMTSKADADSPTFGGGTDRERMIAPFGVAYDAVSDRIFVSDGANHRVLVFGANVSGEPIEVRGDVDAVSTTENPDGSTTITVVNDDGDTFSVTFPAGTTPEAGADSIVVDVETWNGMPLLVIEADLPAGETKTVAISRGPSSNVCIYDHADMTGFLSGGNFSCKDHGWEHRYKLPGPGACRTIVVDGDPGDNGHPQGLHDVDMCVDSSNQIVTISGLLHTTIGFDPAPDSPEWDHAEHGHDRDSRPALSNAGCSASGGTTGGIGLFLITFLLYLGRRPIVHLRATRR